VKTLHTYLVRQILASLLITVGVFTFVLLLGNVLREILSLLLHRQASFGLVAQAIGLLIPFVWAFALPMGMLTATLLIFGRFSADQELTAVRASGVSLLSLITPILLLSIALCALSALVNMEIAPRCRVAYRGLLARLTTELANMQLPEGRFIHEFKGFIFFVGRNQKQDLENVMVYQLEDETNVIRTVRAPRGRVELDQVNRRVNVELFDAKSVFADGVTAKGDVSLELPLDASTNRVEAARVDEMTFGQLWDELRRLDRLGHQRVLKGKQPKAYLTATMNWLRIQQADLTSPVRYQIHRQVAFSFACFGFTLVGIPLGIRVHRRETNVGIAIALGLVAVYYSFLLLGQAMEMRSEWAPHLLVWIPNFIFQAVGAVLLWRANRGM
jgi:lipopolysaccharide export system permease protein